MNRLGLVIALAAALAVGLLFGLRPDLDLAFSALFFDPVQRLFPLRTAAAMETARDVAEWILIILALPAAIVLLIRLFRPGWMMPISPRAALFLLATLALGPGLLVNGILKQQWPRPRPVQVTEFGGAHRFVAWWDPRGTCRSNCSFVSGEASSAFWSTAPAALVPAPWRALAFGAAIAYGGALSLLRVVAGAHFLTDVVFAGVFTFLIVWLAYRVLLRRQAP